MWNNGADEEIVVRLLHVPFDKVDITELRLDDEHFPLVPSSRLSPSMAMSWNTRNSGGSRPSRQYMFVIIKACSVPRGQIHFACVTPARGFSTSRLLVI